MFKSTSSVTQCCFFESQGRTQYYSVCLVSQSLLNPMVAALGISQGKLDYKYTHATRDHVTHGSIMLPLPLIAPLRTRKRHLLLPLMAADQNMLNRTDRTEWTTGSLHCLLTLQSRLSQVTLLT